jgi:dipeptidyl aminopeptidase/acylaminoacyl peptidase
MLPKSLFLLLLGLLPGLLARPLAAQNFTLPQVLGAPFPSELVAAPVGQRAAWVYNQRGERNVWLVDGPGATPRQLTQYQGDNGQEISQLAFAPDGSALIYVRGGAPNGAGDIPNPAQLQPYPERAIFRVKVDNGAVQKLANGTGPRLSPQGDRVAYLSGGQVWLVHLDSLAPRKLFQVRGGQGALRWSPDGRRLAFVSSRGDHSWVGVFDLTSQKITFMAPGADLDGYPAWSPDGQQVAFVRIRAHRDALAFEPEPEALPWSIWVADAATGQGRPLWEARPGRGSTLYTSGLVADNLLFWTADQHLVFPYEGDGWNHLYALPVRGGEPRLLTPGAGEVEYAALGADKKTIFYNANIGDIDRRHVWQVSATAPAKPLTSGQGIEWLAAQAGDGTLFCLRSGSTTPARPAALVQGQLADLAPAAIPADFPANLLVEPQAVTFPAADGRPVLAQLFLPRQARPGDQRPAIIFFHGGSRRQMLLGFNYGAYYHHAYAMNQYLANQGYVVLSVNFRSGIGYGLDFREAPNYGATGASEYADVVGAGLYLRGRPEVGQAKLGLWGGSYGGYLTALGLARSSDLFACGVDIHGCHDWNVIVKNFVPSYNPALRPEWARRAYESSPMHFIDGWRSPVLLVHGDDDRNVPFSETVTLAEALAKRNVHTEQLLLPDEVHSFLLHRNWLAVYGATADFLGRFLRK